MYFNSALKAAHSKRTPGSALQTHSRQRTPNALQAAHSKRIPVMHSQRTLVMHLQRTPTSFKYLHPHSQRTPGSALPMHSRQRTPNALQTAHSMQCTPNALQWCTHNALHPNLNICTRTRNALGLYQIPFNKVKKQCTPNALLRTPTHSMSDILARTANALFNRKGVQWFILLKTKATQANRLLIFFLPWSYGAVIFQTNLPHINSAWKHTTGFENKSMCKFSQEL